MGGWRGRALGSPFLSALPSTQVLCLRTARAGLTLSGRRPCSRPHVACSLTVTLVRGWLCPLFCR